MINNIINVKTNLEETIVVFTEEELEGEGMPEVAEISSRVDEVFKISGKIHELVGKVATQADEKGARYLEDFAILQEKLEKCLLVCTESAIAVLLAKIEELDSAISFLEIMSAKKVVSSEGTAEIKKLKEKLKKIKERSEKSLKDFAKRQQEHRGSSKKKKQDYFK